MVTPHVDRGGPARDGAGPFAAKGTPGRGVESGGRLGPTVRWALVAAAAALSAVLATAAWLPPAPEGFGTHRGLGLPPCTFLTLTGRRCPSCGMTTAFAWTVRGRPDRAWRANPAGSLLAPACLALVPWLLACAAAGRPLGTRTIDGPLIALVVATVALSFVAWIVRLVPWRVLG